MAVLISDGNSQDHWEHVLAASERLRATNADVRAITVSHEYFFRELEMYAGNKWLVYIDARIRQFLDEAEHSLMNCQGPAGQLWTFSYADKQNIIAYTVYRKVFVNFPRRIICWSLQRGRKLLEGILIPSNNIKISRNY